MSFLYTLKRAFNIGEDPDDNDEALLSADDAAEDNSDASAGSVPSTDPSSAIVDEEGADALAADMLAAVVELFNSTQPEFVRSCLNTDEQCRYLLGAISADVRSAMERAAERAHRLGMERFGAERTRLTDELKALRGEKEALERRREEYKSEHLSAERQKRALTDRVRDLEQHAATLEAEREQYMLENRSMLNKLRVAGVLGKEIPDTAVVDPAIEAELESLRRQLGEAAKAAETLNAEHAETVEKLAVAVKELDAKSDALSQVEQARKSADDARAEAEAALSAVRAELEEARSRISTLEASLAKGSERSKMLSRELEESRTAEQTLREENTRLYRSLDQALAPADGVTLATIPDHLPAPAAKPDTKSSPAVAPAEPAATKAEPAPGRRRGRKPKKQPRISAIDELMDSTDWLQSPTPEPEPHTDKTPDDFGYRPPVKSPADDDQRQLSLW